MKHGGDLSEAIAAFGGKPGDWIDLSTGINPHVYPYKDVATDADWTRLPSADKLDALILAARTAYQVPKSLAVAATPGTQILLSQLPTCMPLGPLHILGPTYSGHNHAWSLAGRELHEVNSMSDLLKGLKTNPGHVLLVNPNNPNAHKYNPTGLLALAETMSTTGHHLIIDEAFADCVPETSILPHLTRQQNVLVLRSFGKFYGLAGLRLGFLIGPGKICGAMTMKLDSWAVSGPALSIGAKALSDALWRATTNERLRAEMASLLSVLEEAGLKIVGHTPLYALVEHPKARALHSHLAKTQIWTRRFDYDPTWLRLGLPPNKNALLRLAEGLVSFKKANP